MQDIHMLRAIRHSSNLSQNTLLTFYYHFTNTLLTVTFWQACPATRCAIVTCDMFKCDMCKCIYVLFNICLRMRRYVINVIACAYVYVCLCVRVCACVCASECACVYLFAHVHVRKYYIVMYNN